jgi:diguanylate cyclase (GGDEF)-like protein
MTNPQAAVSRILTALSAVIEKPVSLVDAQSPEAGQFAIRLSVPRLAIVSTDDKPFSEPERKLVTDIFEVIRMADESDARFAELEQRMLSLQRENLDLVVKNRTLNEVSTRDTLTGLYNRWYVIDKIDSEINRSLRHGSPMSVLMLDLDHFKRINDTYGHAVGDQVLQWVGKTLKESCRVYDIPARYGGEEFCIVLPETRVGSTNAVADRIRTKMDATTLQIGEVALKVTASIGIAGVDSMPSEGLLSPAALIDRADRALYSAKHRGRNRIEFWHEPPPETGH